MGRGEEPATLPQALADLRCRVDAVLEDFLARERAALAEADPEGAVLVDELLRLVRAGGKRLRPAFCYLGHLAAGGSDGEPIVRAAASLELLHTFALIHDDVMDGSTSRRGVPATHVRFAEEHRRRGLADPERFGAAAAILVGDLAAVLADRLFLASGFPAEVLLQARHRYDSMRLEMAVGQLLDLAGGGADEARARRIAALKTGSYTVEGPLQVGAALAGAGLEVMAALSRSGRPLGEAFQIRDDLLAVLGEEEDSLAGRPSVLRALASGSGGEALRAGGEAVVAADAVGRARALVRDLVAEAVVALEAPVLERRAAAALRSVAEALAAVAWPLG